MAEKYYNISPYAFCANNPMRYSDSDGMKLIITSANGYTLEYSAGMQYKGNDSAVKEQVGVLNQMNGVENGQKVLSTLINSDKLYNITNGRSANGTASTIKNKNEVTVRMNNENDFISVSHELFHCYQYDNGQGGASIFNEVEAYLYSTTLSMSVFGGSGSLFYMGIPSSAESADFEEVVNKLQYGISFSLDDFNKTVSLFQNNSSVNATGVYNNYPLKGNKESKSLISQFYPFIPFQ